MANRLRLNRHGIVHALNEQAVFYLCDRGGVKKCSIPFLCVELRKMKNTRVKETPTKICTHCTTLE